MSLSDAHERALVRAMELSLAGFLVYGLATFQFGMASNGAIALGVTLLPAALHREYGYSMDAGIALWITLSIFLHSVGSPGPYVWFEWYDSSVHHLVDGDRRDRVRVAAGA